MLEIASPQTVPEKIPLSDSDRKEFTEGWNQLEVDFTRTVELLKGDILENRWASVIADDTRGRFPAMVIRGVMSRASPGTVPLTFLAGPRWVYGSGTSKENRERVERVYDNYLGDLHELIGDGRALLVTETIDLGNNASLMLGLLQRSGIKSDILTFSHHGRQGMDKVNRQLPENNQDVRLYDADSPEVDSFMDWVKSRGIYTFRFPLSKAGITSLNASELGIPEHHGSSIPVAAANTNSEEYILWRKLAQDMAERVYQNVFTVEPEAEIAENKSEHLPLSTPQWLCLLK